MSAADTSIHGAQSPRKRWAPSARRAQLLAVSVDVFARLGYQGTAVDDIARAAGVTRTLIYKHFADKDEIYLECVRTARAELEELFIAAAVAQETSEQQLRAGIAAYFAFVRDGEQRWDMLFGGGSAVAGTVATEAADLRYDTAEKIATLVRAAAPHVDDELASATAHAISGTCEQLAKWWRRHPEVELDTLTDHCMHVLWSGIAAIAESGPVASS